MSHTKIIPSIPWAIAQLYIRTTCVGQGHLCVDVGPPAGQRVEPMLFGLNLKGWDGSGTDGD